MNANSAVERAAAIAGFFELKSTQRLCYSDDRTVVLMSRMTLELVRKWHQLMVIDI